jgi:hypothetical protein|tara:strand:+ start:2787 stop:2987 length:201 start_codon:yes stop_codon:yes gene_type:complete
MPNKNKEYTPQSKEPKKTYSGSNPQTKGLKYYEKFPDAKKKKKMYGGKMEYKQGGKVRDAFTQQYD